MKSPFATALILSCLYPSLGHATDNLPKGLGAFVIGHRSYSPQTEKFSSSGEKQSIAEPFQKEFDGTNLLEGAGGDDLRKLADQLSRFDGNTNAPGSLLNTLYLGRLEGDVKAEVNATAFVMGYGWTNNLGFYVNVPWVEASVESTLRFVNDNNVNEVRSRLGDTAFEELKTGLTRAENIQTADIINSITSMGYVDPNESWSYEGVGDIELGAQYSGREKFTKGRPPASWHIRPAIVLPTGYTDDPAILNDVNIGRGYLQATSRFAGSIKLDYGVFFASGFELGLGMPTKAEKRVPEKDESLVDSSRTTDVDMTPGIDTNFDVTTGVKRPSFGFNVSVGVKSHTKDNYSGSLDGNYDALSEGSDTQRLYQKMIMTYDTLEMFKRKQFAVPSIISLGYQSTLSGKNVTDETYYELALTSFFSTPRASSGLDNVRASKKKKKHRRRLARKKSKKKNKKYAH